MPPLVSAVLPLVPVLSVAAQDTNMCRRSQVQRALLVAVACTTLLSAVCGAAANSIAENALPAPPPPPPPASAMQRLWEELGTVKTMMSIISDELNRFNTLYLGKLEHRMLAIATALSSVDSNVKNLQERAHVWDTFQLHVAAWNEQIKTLDKKVDILSRGQEKLDLMDGKLASLLNLDYKVERVAGKIEETENKVSALGRSVERGREGVSLFGDVATRGVVSTLRIIERKIDRLASVVHPGERGAGGGGGGGGHGGGGGGRMRNSGGMRSGPVEADEVSGASVSALGRGKLIIRCNAPAAMEELLRDVAAKVDVLFDKAEGSDAPPAAPAPPLQHILHVSELRDHSENKLLERLWKRLTSPSKRSARALEALEAAVRGAANATLGAAERSLACCSAASRRLDRLALAADAHDAARARLEEGVAKAAEAGRRAEEAARRAEEAARRLEERERGCPAGDAPTHAGSPVVPPTERSSGHRGAADDRPQRRPRPPDADEGSGDGDGGGGGEGGGGGGGGDVEPPFIPVVVEASAGRGCEDLLATRHARHSGVYKFSSTEHRTSRGALRDFLQRYCDMNTDGGGWTVLQRRGDFSGPRQNFTLSWLEYKHGFGDLDREFWFGNDFIHKLTYHKEMTLRVDLESFTGKKAWAEYSTFKVASDDNLYQLTVGGYSGNASDAMKVHDGAYFSTIDKKNDAAPPCCPCAAGYGGGWWFDSCFEANLNGVYYTPQDTREDYRGIIWEKWLGNESLKMTEMKMRPKYLTGLSSPEDPGFDEHGSSSVDDVNPLDIPEDP